MKKNYFYLSLAIIATTYQAFSLMFYPELAPDWLIRFFGFLFALYAIGAVLEIQTLYLKNKIKTLDEKLEEFINPNIIDEWLKKNADPEIAKQVELELEELCKKQSTKDRILSETSEDTKQKAIDYANDLVSIKETLEGRRGFIPDGNWNSEEEVQLSDYDKQGTLEEAAHKLFSTMPSEISTSTAKSKAIELATWEQERMYGEYGVGAIAKEAYKIGIRGLSIEDFEKWFNERKK